VYQKKMHRLSGYRNIGPVVAGNNEWKMHSIESCSSIILSLIRRFYDERLKVIGDEELFKRLEQLAVLVYRYYTVGVVKDTDVEARSLQTYSVVLAWAACDRMANLAKKSNREASYCTLTSAASVILKLFNERCFNEHRNCFTSHMHNGDVEANLLSLPELGIIRYDDSRFISTVAVIEKELKKGLYVLSKHTDKYTSIQATLLYIKTLVGLQRTIEAREHFQLFLKNALNSSGLLSESINPETHQLWGNFPYTHAMITLIQCAVYLSEDRFRSNLI